MGASTPPPGFDGEDPPSERPGPTPAPQDPQGSDVPGGPQHPQASTLPRYEEFAGSGDPWGPPPPGVPGPLGVFATVRAALSLYGADALVLWQVMAVVIIPLQLLEFLLRIISVPNGAVLRNARIYVLPGTGGAYAGISALGYVISALVLLLATGAAYRILLGRHLHHPAGLVTSFSFALDRWGPLLWVSVLAAVLTVIGFICLIIPGIYLTVALAVSVPVLMAEDNRGMAALSRSRQLMSEHWWHALGCLIVALVAAAIAQAVILALVGPIDRAIAPHSIAGFLLIDAILSIIASVIVSPFTAAVSVVLYVDLLLRKRDPHLSQLLA